MSIATAITAREFELTGADFKFLAGQVHELTGIVIHERKRDMIYARLSRRLRTLGMTSFSEYCDFLGSPEGGAEIAAMINAVTTNLTHFFREPHHFEHLRQTALPGFVASARNGADKRLRLWSAGCSSGEEPYSIAMTVKSTPVDLSRWDVRILATDLDSDMVARGSAGSYKAADAESIPTDLAAKYTDEVRTTKEPEVRMRDGLRQMIAFKQLNLVGAWPMRGPFDAIFCRNVMIYFDADAKARLVDRFAELLRLDGWLYIGHSESLMKMTDRFQLVGRTIYRRVR